MRFSQNKVLERNGDRTLDRKIIVIRGFSPITAEALFFLLRKPAFVHDLKFTIDLTPVSDRHGPFLYIQMLTALTYISDPSFIWIRCCIMRLNGP